MYIFVKCLLNTLLIRACLVMGEGEEPSTCLVSFISLIITEYISLQKMNLDCSDKKETTYWKQGQMFCLHWHQWYIRQERLLIMCKWTKKFPWIFQIEGVLHALVWENKNIWACPCLFVCYALTRNWGHYWSTSL
jgi:hypothetical protein